ncbi:MAG: 5-formyltetrahydrofolate cyclo-ligase [Nitrospinae bacterium]|nr:5-formyltetrahydrofolate cyclo-ligase [Nitrospinota bacterium]
MGAVATETLVRQKAAIRRKILDRRQSQDPEVRADHSRRIIAALLRHEAFIQAKAILVYLSKDEEVGTDALLAPAFESGKRVFVPVVDRDSHELRIAELSGPDIRYQLGPFGIRQPLVEEGLNFVPPEAVDLVVAPGVAFDRKGGRLGHGKGYYDRLLSRLGSHVTRVALAFDFQVLDAVPQDGNDVRMDTLITEKSTLNCSGI